MNWRTILVGAVSTKGVYRALKLLEMMKKIIGIFTSRRDFLSFWALVLQLLLAAVKPYLKVIPFVAKTRKTVAGVANCASFYDGNDFASLLVKNREGRPIFLEANDLCDKGGITARVQASVLNMYDLQGLKTYS